MLLAWMACLAALAGLVATTPAKAGRPLQTEDAGLIEPGRCEAEASSGRQRSGDGLRSRDGSLGGGCALGAAAQASLALGRSREAGAPALRSADLGLKLDLTPFLGGMVGGDGWALALATGWTREPGNGWRRAVHGFTLAGSPVLGGGWTAHLNLGHERDVQARQGRTPWALALEHEGHAGLSPMAEVFGDDREPASWNLGLRWEVLPQRLWLDAAWGRQMRSGRPQAASLGAKLSF